MKSASKRINLILKITAIYAVAMLTILILSLSLAFNYSAPTESTTVERYIETEYVYVVKDEIKDTEPQETDTDKIYTVREHMGMIGIFDESGALVRVLEVYVRTLPEADKRMLKEGFEVVGTKQLNAIIEDYDG